MQYLRFVSFWTGEVFYIIVVIIHSNILYLYRFQIIGYPQPAVIIPAAFFKVKLLAVSKRSVLRMIEEHILHAEPFSQLTGIFYRGMVLLVWVENIRL